MPSDPSEPPAPAPPPAWDRLEGDSPVAEVTVLSKQTTSEEEPPTVVLFAACWADLVTMMAVATAALLALVAIGHRAEPAILPWAGGVALCWWWLAASATVAVRRGTPGMLMAGLVAKRPVPPRRVASVLAAALASCASLGLLALLGPRRSLVGAAAGSPLVTATPTP